MKVLPGFIPCNSEKTKKLPKNCCVIRKSRGKKIHVIFSMVFGKFRYFNN